MIPDGPGKRPDVEGFEPGPDVARDGGRRVRALGVPVVFENDQQRHGPQRRKVQGFIQHALPQGSIADKRHGDRRRVPTRVERGRQRHPGGDGYATALYSVAEKAARADVLAAASAGADSRWMPHDLRHEASRVARSCQVVAMATVI
jgi:hypothetical protein